MGRTDDNQKIIGKSLLSFTYPHAVQFLLIVSGDSAAAAYVAAAGYCTVDTRELH